MSEEIWKAVKGYEGYYEVSNLGRVKSLDRFVCSNVNLSYANKKVIGGLLMSGCDKKGYKRVGFSVNGVRTTKKVHRLVAQTFIPNPQNKPQVNHINEIKDDNRVENLNWMTASENINHGTCLKRMAETNTNGNKSVSVIQLTLDGEFVKEWVSMSEAGRNGYKHTNISACCSGKEKTHYGFKWKIKGEL